MAEPKMWRGEDGAIWLARNEVPRYLHTRFDAGRSTVYVLMADGTISLVNSPDGCEYWPGYLGKGATVTDSADAAWLVYAHSVLTSRQAHAALMRAAISETPKSDVTDVCCPSPTFTVR
jgi:hypothetical protein